MREFLVVQMGDAESLAFLKGLLPQTAAARLDPRMSKISEHVAVVILCYLFPFPVFPFLFSVVDQKSCFAFASERLARIPISIFKPVFKLMRTRNLLRIIRSF